MDDLQADQLEENATPSAQAQQEQTRKDVGFLTDVLKLVSGTGFIQILSLIVSPILGRLFLPEAFGISQNFSSIVAVLAVLAALRYEVTIMLPKAREGSANQLAVSMLLTGISFLILTPILWFGREPIAQLLRSPELAGYLWLAPLSVAVTSVFAALRNWNSRNRKYLRLSAAQVSSEVVADATKLSLGFSGFKGGGSLIAANVVGQVVSTGVLGWQIWRDDGAFIRSSLRWREMMAGIRQYKKFPLYNIWAAFLSNASLQMPTFMLSAMFSPTVTGFYSLGYRMLRLPVTLISNSIGQVFYQRASRAYYEGSLTRLVAETFNRLVVFGLFPMLLVTLIGKELFVVLFGPEWAEAGVYSQILSLWTFFVFMVAPLSGLTNVLGRNEVSLVLNLVVFVTRVASLAIGGWLQDARLALILFSASGVVTYAVYCLWATRISGVSVRETLRMFFDGMLSSAPFLGVVALFKWVIPLPQASLTVLQVPLQGLLLLVISGVMSAAYYLWALWRDPTLRSALTPMLARLGFRKK